MEFPKINDILVLDRIKGRSKFKVNAIVNNLITIELIESAYENSSRKGFIQTQTWNTLQLNGLKYPK